MPAPDFDNIAVSSFEVVPDKLTTKIILMGTGVPRPVVVSLSAQTTFDLTGKMLMACDHVDHGQFVAVLRKIVERVAGAQVGDGAPQTSLAAPADPRAPSSPSSDSSGQIAHASLAGEAGEASLDLLIEHAARFQSQCRAKGLSDELIAKLIELSMGENALLALAEKAISRGVTGFEAASVGSSPPWSVDTAAGRITIDVDPSGDSVVIRHGADEGQDDIDIFSVEAHLLAASLQAASSYVARARMTDGRLDNSPVTAASSAGPSKIG